MGSKTDPLLAKAEPISDDDGVSGIRYFFSSEKDASHLLHIELVSCTLIHDQNPLNFANLVMEPVASLAPAAGKPSPCPNKGESDGAAAEPTDVTTIQVPAEPQGQPQTAAVAPVETKKYKVKSEHPGNKDKKGGPSQPGGESEVEIITESLTYESLRKLQKDLA
ncbi:hypothetical protein DUI87_08230 [Hirundo rustica rustica]|uniref:Uncharacterized protein n=1 Tax=Hirundo rustica rustica TaxID=333673 RepID=A0A3M0KS84_HIRRU|nr:hypothetical protein DUI87_08230 [Hirundo rustica rustica]